MPRRCVGDGIRARIFVRVSVGVRIGDEAGVVTLIPILAGGGMLDWDGDGHGLGFGGTDDSGGVVSVDLGQCAEEQAADVGEDGGAARGDAVLGQEFVEVLQGMVDALGSLEAFEIADELKVVIGGLLLDLLGVMLATEAGVRVGNGKTAAAAGGSAMGATGG
jgi:hypothetical protein